MFFVGDLIHSKGFICRLIQKLAVCNLQVKFILVPVFVNKVLSEHWHAHSLAIVYGCFCAAVGRVKFLLENI